MEHLGFWGIIRLTTQIILKNLKHFLCIACLLALPYALNLIIFGPISLKKAIQNLVISISLLYKVKASHDQGPLVPSDWTPHDQQALISNPQLYYPSSLLLLLSLSIFRTLISFLCILLVTFSVCRACIDKCLDLKGSLRGVRRSAVVLVLTVLLMVAVILTFFLVSMLVMAIIVALLYAVNANVMIPITIMAIGVIGGGLYLAITLGLAETVAILEEKKGWEAMRRSMYLMKGNRGTAVGLYCFYGVVSMAAFACVSALSACVSSSSSEASVLWRWSAGGVMVGMQACISLWCMAAQVVLYMACKRRHQEPPDTLVAASAQFGPQQLPAKYLDLETATFVTSAH